MLAPGLANNGNLQGANVFWDALYIGIGDANLLIQNATASSSTSTAIKNTALGEGYFSGHTTTCDWYSNGAQFLENNSQYDG